MSIPINLDNLHHATIKKIEMLSDEGFSIHRYKREETVYDEHDIDEYSVSSLVGFCEDNGIDPDKAIVGPDDGVGCYGPPVLRYPRLETDQEAAQRAIGSWERQQEKKIAKKAQEEEERKRLKELAEKYPDEIS